MIKSAKEILLAKSEKPVSLRKEKERKQKFSTALVEFCTDWLEKHDTGLELWLKPVDETTDKRGFEYSETDEEGTVIFEVKYDYTKCTYAIEMMEGLGFNIFYFRPFWRLSLPIIKENV